MWFVTPVDRVLQAGGQWVTMVFWLVAVVGGISVPFDFLPRSVSMGLAGFGATIYWVRFKNISLADLVARILFTRARNGRD